jgi:hypothetical protein
MSVNFFGTVRCHVSESSTSRSYGLEILKYSHFLLYISSECVIDRPIPQSRIMKNGTGVWPCASERASHSCYQYIELVTNLHSQILWRLMNVEIRQRVNYFPSSNATHCFRGVTYIRWLPKSIMACRPISGGMHYKAACVQWRLILEGSLHSVAVCIVGHPIFSGSLYCKPA